jgi:hypothetical protein
MRHDLDVYLWNPQEVSAQRVERGSLCIKQLRKCGGVVLRHYKVAVDEVHYE